MSVTKVTLAKEDNNGVEYIYPKTTSDIVEHQVKNTDEYTTVKKKLDDLDDVTTSIRYDLNAVRNEVTDARTAKSDGTKKTDLKTRIDEDYDDLERKIKAIGDRDINEFSGILSISKGGTSADNAFDALFNLSYHNSKNETNLNLNSYIKQGYWHFQTPYLPTDNAPVENTTGYLFVIRGDEGSVKQIWMNQGDETNHQNIYVRTCINDIWQPWVKIADQKDLDNITIEDLLRDYIVPIEHGGTSAATAVGALFNLSYHISRDAESLDLNEYKDQGYWYFPSTYLPTDNAPIENTTGYLFIIRGSGTLIKQIWMNQGNANNHQDIYVRTYGGTNWQPWVGIATNIDIEELESKITELINSSRKMAIVGSGNPNDEIQGYHLVASGTMINYSNVSLMFAVHDTKFYNTGILVLDLRKADTEDEIICGKFGWIARSGFNTNDFGLRIQNSSNTWSLYYNLEDRRYYRVIFEVLEESGTRDRNAVYTLYSNRDAYDIATDSFSGTCSVDLCVSDGRKSGSNSGLNSIAAGEKNNIAAGENSIVIGSNNDDESNYSICIGDGNKISDEHSKTITDITVHDIMNSESKNGIIGYENIMNRDYGYKPAASYVVGTHNIMHTKCSYTMGYKNKNYGNNSYIFGENNEIPQLIDDALSDIMGYDVYHDYENSVRSYIVGYNNIVGSAAYVLGQNNKCEASGYVIGNTNKISHPGSYLIGESNHNNESDTYSSTYTNAFTIGIDNICTGVTKNNVVCTKDEINGDSASNSMKGRTKFTDGTGIAIGFSNKSLKTSSAAIGHALIADNAGGTVCGIANATRSTTKSSITDSSTNGDVFTVGNGYLKDVIYAYKKNDAGNYLDNFGNITTNINEAAKIYNFMYDRSNAFRVTYAGATYGLLAHNNSGADYAEFVKEWYDGNPNNEDRVGYMVTIGEDGLLHKANEGDYIIGITSGNPSIVGNSDEDYYHKYERDKFNRIILETVEVEETSVDDEGNIVTKKVPIQRRKISPSYNESLQSSYIERAKRPEWDYVGMRGIVPCRDDGTCVARGFCKCGIDGIATKADIRGFDTYYVIERIDEETISVEVR